LIKPEHLVFEIHKNVTSSQTIKRYTQNQSLKWTQRTMGKTILILQRLDFCFQNIKQLKDYIEWRVLGLWPKSLIFKRSFPKIDIFLISFQQLDLNRHNLWSMRFDSRTRKIVEQWRTSIESAKYLTWNDINSSRHFLKSWDTLGAIQWTLKRKKQAVFRSAGGQRKMIIWRIGERRTMWFKER